MYNVLWNALQYWGSSLSIPALLWIFAAITIAIFYQIWKLLCDEECDLLDLPKLMIESAILGAIMTAVVWALGLILLMVAIPWVLHPWHVTPIVLVCVVPPILFFVFNQRKKEEKE